MTERERFEAAMKAAGYQYGEDALDCAYAGWQAALVAQQKAEPVALNNYVQPVPDHCDRITWRGQYFHLPLAAPPLDPEGIRLLREAREWVISNGECAQDAADLRDGIDAYLAKVQHEL